MNNLADAYCMQGKYAQGEALLVQTVEIERRALGPKHPQTLMSLTNLADAYAFQGEYGRAEALFGETIEMGRRSLGQEDPLLLAILAEYATLYHRERKYAAAETHAAEVLALRRHALGSDNPDTMVSAADLALTYQSEGKFEQSEPLAREAFDFYNKKRPDNWHRFRAESLLRAILSGETKYAEAEPLLLTGFQGMVARKAQISVPDQYYVDRAREWILQLYQAWGKPQKAAEWK
jgi:eukaryotic-like serine/threonine-protein kinase